MCGYPGVRTPPEARFLRSILIDSRGVPWHPDDWYRQASGTLPPQDVTDFAIKNLGCVLVLLKPNLATVRIAPGRTKTSTVLALLQLLEPYRSNRVGLTWYAGRWHHEIMPDGERLSTRILGLLARHSTEKDQRFLTLERSVAKLPHNSELTRIIDLWRYFGGALDARRHDQTLHELLDGRFTVSSLEDDTSRLLFSQVGNGYVMYRNDFAALAVGQRVENQPDAVYGRFVANGLREAAIRNEPMLNDIDALVRSPGRQEQRIRYTRLTLPILGPHNKRQLLSATLLDRCIDLRIDLLDQEAENVVD